MTYEHAVFALCFKLVVSSCALSIVLDVGSMVWRTCFDTLCVLFDHAMVLTYKLSSLSFVHGSNVSLSDLHLLPLLHRDDAT